MAVKAVFNLYQNAYNIFWFFSLALLPRGTLGKEDGSYYAPKSMNSEHLQLILDASLWFPQHGDLIGYEKFTKMLDQNSSNTQFVSHHIPDMVFTMDVKLGDAERLVILPNLTETIKIPFKNVVTYLVMLADESSYFKTRFTCHLVYIRQFSGEQKSVEWDLYSFHFHSQNGSFASAFYTPRAGPERVTLGLAHSITRSKRGEEEDFLYELFSGQEHNMKKKHDLADLTKSMTESETDSVSINVEQQEQSEQRIKKTDSEIQDLEKLEAPYVGIGDCPYILPNEQQTVVDLEKSTEATVEYFLKVLRVQCKPKFMEQAFRLFDTELIISAEGDEGGIRFIINKKHPLWDKKAIGEPEWMDVSSAIFLSGFSHVYLKQLQIYNNQAGEENPDRNRSPLGEQLSGTARTLTLFTFKVFQLMHSAEKIHAVKLAYMLIMAVQAQRTELVSARDELDKCEKCFAEKDRNFNDQVQLFTLMKFIVDNFDSIVTSGSSAEGQFNTFYLNAYQTVVQYVKNKTPFVF